MLFPRYCFAILCFLALNSSAGADEKLSVLLLDGRNNHDWVSTTDALRASLEHTGRFRVTVETAPEPGIPRKPRVPKSDDPEVLSRYESFVKAYEAQAKSKESAFQERWQKWLPDFASHDLVLLNYNGSDWPEPMRKAFVDYVKGGGGVVLVHAANNAFRNWEEFNEIIGMGWRPAPYGKAIKIDPKSGDPYWDKEAGNSSHGSKHPFQVTVRKENHPIMRDLPKAWMHARDELYHDMRGPAKNMTILSSAWSDPEQRGSGKHEPITWEVSYGKGRVIVTSMGHLWKGDTEMDSLYCAGFQNILARSCQYVATGEVTVAVSHKFPGESEPSIQPPREWAKFLNPEDPENSVIRWDTVFGSPEGLKVFESASGKKKADPYCMLTPEEELSTFDLAPGYIAELVAAEPEVREPVLTVWDGNGAMYVAEMRSYMQDEKGTGTKELKNSRIQRLEDTNGDGVYDKVTTFADHLNLPRAILPLDDRIAVRESDTMDVLCFRDTDGDGVADEKTLLYERGPDGRNNPEKSVEHQDSGLIWNIDNSIYITYNTERYRFTDETWKPEKTTGHWTQWGLTHNDTGDLYWVHNSDPVAAPFLHPKYWDTVNRLAGKSIRGIPIDMEKPYDPDFMTVKSLCLLDDRGGAAAETRAFTSACGQSIYRGNKFPLNARGNHFVCDPTIHVVRRSVISKKEGLDFFTKTEPDDREFLRSSDINSRFINTASGPDGCLYVTDMYRGIIQDAGWLSPGPRENIVRNGLHDNNQHGRIWRIRHADHTPGALPKMLDESTFELLRHLEHPNGWWRDTAQKLIILREDRDTVAPLLKGMAEFDENTLTRLHALWTLEGMDELEPEFVASRYKDRDARIRRAAVQISERYLIGEPSPFILEEISSLAEDSDPEVAKQLIHSLGLVEGAEKSFELIQEIAQKHSSSKGVMLAAGISLWGKEDLPLVQSIKDGSAFGGDAGKLTAWKNTIGNWNRGIEFPKDFPDDQKRLISEGEAIYFRSCYTCHGSDGKGLDIPGTSGKLAPSLLDSARVHGTPEQLVPVLLHGLAGPIDGKTYQAGFMAPGKALGVYRDDHIAQVLSYIRYAWGKKDTPISKEEVEAIHRKHSDRSTPWTDGELNSLE